MSKIYIRTGDIFNIKDDKRRMDVFNGCRKKALKCGLICHCHIDGENTTLFLEGTKSQFIKYYLSTMCEDDKTIIDGIKRILYIMSSK